jgi:hypothetical protein
MLRPCAVRQEVLAAQVPTRAQESSRQQTINSTSPNTCLLSTTPACFKENIYLYLYFYFYYYYYHHYHYLYYYNNFSGKCGF